MTVAEKGVEIAKGEDGKFHVKEWLYVECESRKEAAFLWAHLKARMNPRVAEAKKATAER